MEIFKFLPKTNCKECGFPTCLAFAMQLASAKVEIEKCPYVSEETKEKLAEATAPPIRKVTLGTGEHALAIGEETVLYRHDKTFVHPTGIAVLIRDTEDKEVWKRKITSLNNLKFERIGVTLKAEIAFLECCSGNADKFIELVEMVIQLTPSPLILASENIEVLTKAIKLTYQPHPLLYAATDKNLEEMIALAKEYQLPIVAKGKGLDEVISLTSKMISVGLKEIVIDSLPDNLKQAYQDQIVTRRQALISKFKPLGFPTITFPYRLTDNLIKEYLYASTFVIKYGSIIVLSELMPEYLFPLLVLRLNIYTDPQRPMTIEEGIYEINGPAQPDSPVIITTNFSLTYFVVSGEIDASRVPTWLLIKDTEGLSTLTAWSAGKFNGELISMFVKKCGIGEKITHRKLVIPGYVSSIKGEIEEELPGWEVIVGPREASELPVWLQSCRKM